MGKRFASNFTMKGGSETFNKFIHNKTVLIIVLAFSLFNLIGYMMVGRTSFVLIYLLIAIPMYFLSESKNMVLVCGVPLLFVNILVVLQRKYGIMGTGLEGLDNMTSTSPSSSSSSKAAATAATTSSMTQSEQQAAKLRAQSALESKRATANASGATPSSVNYKHTAKNTIDMTHMGDEMPQVGTGAGTGASELELPEPHTEESFEGNNKRGRYRVDYASTIEDAYDELNNVLGGEGIKRLTNDTHNLMQKQLQMAETMKSMGPLVQSMAPLLKQAQSLLAMTPGLNSAVASAAPK